MIKYLMLKILPTFNVPSIPSRTCRQGILMTFGSGINGYLGHEDTNDVSEVCTYVFTVYGVVKLHCLLMLCKVH